MSLYVDDDRRRARSRSRDRRSKDEPADMPSYPQSRESSYVYPEDDLDDRYGPRRDQPPSVGGGLPYPADGGIHQMLPGNQSMYSYDSHQPIYRTASPPAEAPYRSSRDKVESKPPGAFPGDDEQEPHIYTAEPKDSKRDKKEKKDKDKDKKSKRRDDRDDDDNRRPRYAEQRYEDRPLEDDKLNFLPQKYSSKPSEREKIPRDIYSSRGDDEDEKLKYLPSKYGATYADPEPKSPSRYDRREPEVDRLKSLPQKYMNKYADEDEERYSDRDLDKSERRRRKKERDEADLAYGKPPPPRPDSPQTYGSYLSGTQLEDRRPTRYGDEDPRRRPVSPSIQEPEPRRSDPDSRRSNRDSHRGDPRGSRPDVLTVDPGDRDRRRDKSPGPGGLTVDSGDRTRDRSRDRRRDKSPEPGSLTVDSGNRERERSRDKRSRDKSPQPPTARMSNLSVDTGRPSHLSLAAAPGSPLLESYHGTYQESSPMPSPLLLATGHSGEDPSVIEALSPVASDDGGDGKKRNRRARFHDPEDIATRLARALHGDKPPDKGPLVEILPSLTHEQVLELRKEYKALVKTGSQRKGVNIAKHIRARLKDENPNLMKACYSVALGKWESEAYWANFWYQGDKTRRELLIESIMGRTNDEIRQIKDAFTDKKYDNSLKKCMKTELKEDKFKKAVLLVLDERRMDEYDHYGQRLPIDYKLVDRDVDDLRDAVKSEKGGETMMISIILQRSDSHLREVLKEYEHAFRSNFARDSLKKSGNLVGEVLAHVLNGIINRPVRDALLLHHALTASKKDELRHELLTSRLVRMHWDANHMQAVRRAYQERYGRHLQDEVRAATNGQWGVFCEELCIARMPNHVRRFEK